MATEEQIEQWKSEYSRIFAIAGDGEEFIFRPITFQEYEEAIKLDKTSSADAEDFVIRACVLSPEIDEEKLGRMKTGVVSSIADEILDYSGFSTQEKATSIIAEQRKKAEEVQNVMMTFILAVMPYKLEELYAMDFFAVSELLSIAEKIIELRQDMNDPNVQISFGIVSPEPDKKKIEQMRQQIPKQRSGPQPRPQTTEDDPIHEMLLKGMEQAEREVRQ